MTESNTSSVPASPMAEWHEYLRAGRVMLQKCAQCARFIFYPRVLCPHCGGEQLAWHEAEASGTVYSTTVVARKEKDGGPYNVSLIDLDQGVRMMSRVEGIEPEAVKIGQRVRPVTGTIDGEPALLFRLESDDRRH